MKPIARTSCASGNHTKPISHGFSLIELLVVISIIAALLAILMPGLGKARNMARRTVCAGNLKQIDIAMHSYLSINDDTYPATEDPLPSGNWLWMGRGWRDFLMPHLGGKIDVNNPSVLLCPEDYTDPNKYESTSYAYSMAFYHSPEQIDSINDYQDTYGEPPITLQPSIPQRTVSVSKPSRKILIGEWYSNHFRLSDKDPGWWGWSGKRNYLFADGQVRFLEAEEIRTANDDNPNPNLTKNGIKGSDWPR